MWSEQLGGDWRGSRHDGGSGGCIDSGSQDTLVGAVKVLLVVVLISTDMALIWDWWCDEW